jgi:hypothetical protein
METGAKQIWPQGIVRHLGRRFIFELSGLILPNPAIKIKNLDLEVPRAHSRPCFPNPRSEFRAPRFECGFVALEAPDATASASTSVAPDRTQSRRTVSNHKQFTPSKLKITKRTHRDSDSKPFNQPTYVKSVSKRSQKRTHRGAPSSTRLTVSPADTVILPNVYNLPELRTSHVTRHTSLPEVPTYANPCGGTPAPLDRGLWIVDCGSWTVDRGLWTVDCGLWTVDFKQLAPDVTQRQDYQLNAYFVWHQ